MYSLIYLYSVREHNPIKPRFQNNSLTGEHMGLITGKYTGQDCRSAEILWDTRSMSMPPNHTLGSKSLSTVLQALERFTMAWLCLLHDRKGRTKLMWILAGQPSKGRTRQSRYHCTGSHLLLKCWNSSGHLCIAVTGLMSPSASWFNLGRSYWGREKGHQLRESRTERSCSKTLWATFSIKA